MHNKPVKPKSFKPSSGYAHNTQDIFVPKIVAEQNSIPIHISQSKSNLLGDAGSDTSLNALQARTDEIKEYEILSLLQEALFALKRGDWVKGGDFALKALHIDERHGQAWHILAISRDKCGDFTNSLKCYEKALLITPDSLNIAADLGRLAFRMNMHDMAVKFFDYVISVEPDNFEAINNMASSLRELNRLDEAIELLKRVLSLDPDRSELWNTLATIVNAQGDIDNALVFYNEAVRINPYLYQAIYNRAHLKYLHGDFESAMADFSLVIAKFDDEFTRGNAQLAYAQGLIGLGQLEDGWAQYLDRDSDGVTSRLNAIINRPRWDRKSDLCGKHIFVCGEQGLGDEIMFATTLPDLINELGPDGQLSLAVETRLVPLFKRAFPMANVIEHKTGIVEGKYYRFFPDLPEDNDVDQWAFIADFLSRYRNHIDDFPSENVFFKPDPLRVEYWKAQLRALGPAPKVGLLWKSLIKHSARDRFYSSFDMWKDILAIPDLIFVNLQYGDVSEELQQAKSMGLRIWNPPLDLKDDLDDLSALCLAIDVILGPANATINIAGGVGTPCILLTMPNAWTALGTQRYPWYPQISTISAPPNGDWSLAMITLKQRLVAQFVGAKSLSS